MRYKLLFIPTLLIFQIAEAQNGSASVTTSQATVTTRNSPTATPVVQPNTNEAPPATPASVQTSYLDYKNLYESATIEEEVKMAAERFGLTTAQQDTWLVAAGERRETERQARVALDAKPDNYQKDAIYRGLRSSQNMFYETIVGYLNPTQKQAFETDRLILEEKRKRVAKLPPPAPTVTVAPVDSAAIKAAEKGKGTTKKKKKKKAVGG